MVSSVNGFSKSVSLKSISSFSDTKIYALCYFFLISVGLVLRYSYHECLINFNLSDCYN